MADVTARIATSAAERNSTPSACPQASGLAVRRFFTQAGISPYDCVQWELRDAQIADAQGKVIFEQKDVEVPKDWSQTATNIVASKYLHGTSEYGGTRNRRAPIDRARRRNHPRLGIRGRLFPQRRRCRHLP